MLINRKRSYRRGPKYRQTYVPHDQRQLNTQPTPIMDERTAQYYLNQLTQMGYIPASPPPQPPYIVTIKPKGGGKIVFEISNNLTLGSNSNINSDDMELIDINGQPYTSPTISNADILNQVGVHLYPIIANGSLGVFNGTSSPQIAYLYEIDDNTVKQGVTVQPNQIFYISEYSTQISLFNRAIISSDVDNMFYLAYMQNYQNLYYEGLFCSKDNFDFVCDELTVLIK